MTRPHPFDVVAGGLTDGWFSEVREAETQGGGDAADRLWFLQLAPVRRVLRELNPPEDQAAGAVIEEYGTLLYAVYRFWSTGRHSLTLGRESLERALGHDAGTTPEVPHRACYLQLPERLFWTRISESTAPEPLDGLFLAVSAGDREITVLAVLGLRPERGGFSQIAITVPPEDLARAKDLVRRPLFAPVLDGGEQAGVKSLVSEAELLHLAHLALVEVAR